MTARFLMVQGTASSVGKSLLVTGLLRALHRRGLKVAPFKAQNMALNSVVSADGGEIARAQAVQAAAAGLEPIAAMNPILLKPETDRRSQLVVMGRRVGTMEARDYYRDKLALWRVVAAALERLREEFEVVVVEGAGSPAEVNLQQVDIANMKVARWLQCPVLLVGDIDKGGVFASLVGTLELLDPLDRQLVKGMVINKFRGDIELLRPGLEFLERRTGVPVVGVLPYLRNLRVADEDSTSLDTRRCIGDGGVLDIAVIRLPRISNFDEFDLLGLEAGVQVRFVASVYEFGSPDLVILPGTKSTLSDLKWLRASGLAEKILSYRSAGGALMGVCGGMQMMGKLLEDPEGIDGEPGRLPGLGLFPAITSYRPEKVVRWTELEVAANCGLLEEIRGLRVRGYELHNGYTVLENGFQPFRAFVDGHWSPEGAQDSSGWVVGTYLHGLLEDHRFRRRVLFNLAKRKGVTLTFGALPTRNDEYDRWANVVEEHLDMVYVASLVGIPW
jgi:adenosylcobyric acid synthase